MTGTLRWFGHPYDAPAWVGMPEVPRPVGATCGLCLGLIDPDDDGLTVPDGSTGQPVPMHVGCFLGNVGVHPSLLPGRLDA